MQGVQQMAQQAARNGSLDLHEMLLGQRTGPGQAGWLDLSEASPLAASVPVPTAKREFGAGVYSRRACLRSNAKSGSCSYTAPAAKCDSKAGAEQQARMRALKR